MSEPTPISAFSGLGLSASLLSHVGRLGFTTPTAIQNQAIPPALEGRDLVGIAQTGTGKTLAFALPVMARLRSGDIALVIAPTRELAEQIEAVFVSLKARTALLIGGAPMGGQIRSLRNRPEIVIATPGRLEDHLSQRTIMLRNVGIVVLDEADRMLDLGFAPAIRRILDQTPAKRQTMLFSATMPGPISELAQQYLNQPVRIEIERPGTAANDVEQQLAVVLKEDKSAYLGNLLREHKGTVLVFARTRHGARKLARTVRTFGHSAAELHSDRTLAQRRAALHGFKNGDYRVLVATDIAARGIDVKEIALVVNYDVPECAEDYVHRIGRTGRAGSTGKAVTLATPEQHRDVRDIEKLMKVELRLAADSPLRLEMPRTAQQQATPRVGNRRRPSGGHRFRAHAR